LYNGFIGVDNEEDYRRAIDHTTNILGQDKLVLLVRVENEEQVKASILLNSQANPDLSKSNSES